MSSIPDPIDPEHANLSHTERMTQGFPYLPSDPELCTHRFKARQLIRKFNESEDTEQYSEERKAILRQLFNPSSSDVYIEPNFRCEYGFNINIGPGGFINFDSCIMDNAPVTIGKNLMCGPHVQIVTACHPLDPEERATYYEYAKAITIGDDCWLGSGAIILPGVTIGNGVVVGAGAVVTKNIPDFSVCAGNPARVIKTLEESKRKAEENAAIVTAVPQWHQRKVATN